MGSMMINGARYAVATAFSTARAITAITNTNPPSASTAQPPTNGSILLLTSGWPDLNGAVVRAANADADSFDMQGINATDVLRFPAGEGVGTFQVASDFVPLQKVRSVEMAGGEQNFYQYQYVEDDSGRQQQAPTFKSAMTQTLQVDYDPSLPAFDALVELDRLRGVSVLRESLPNGDVLYYVGWISFNKVPTKVLNEFMANQLTFSLTADPIRYPRTI